MPWQIGFRSRVYVARRQREEIGFTSPERGYRVVAREREREREREEIASFF